MSRAAGAATTRDAGTRPPVEGACAASATGGERGTQPREQTLEGELTQVRGQRDEYLDTLQRVRTEYDDYRRRARRE